MFKTNIRTKWYLINMSLYASDLFPESYKSGEISSDLKQIGSAGVGKIRTCWDLCLTVSKPFSRWSAKPFVVHPLPFPTRTLKDLCPSAQEWPQAQEPRMHPFLLAQSWLQ
jgi:hypothetical protein